MVTASPLLSVIIPNYNELKNLERGVLKEIADYLGQQAYTWEVIISDDGSTDSSPAFVESFAKKNLAFRLLKNAHAGKPHALRAGIEASRGKYVLLTDMDQSTPIEEVAKLLAHTPEFKIVIGSRSLVRENSSPLRQLASIVFPTIRRAILLPRIKDTQCGFKLLERQTAKSLFAKLQIFKETGKKAVGWKVTAYDVEMLFLARKAGIMIKEVRVEWRDEDTSVGKKRHFVKESLEMLYEILHVRLNDLLGKYE